MVKSGRNVDNPVSADCREGSVETLNFKDQKREVAIYFVKL